MYMNAPWSERMDFIWERDGDQIYMLFGEFPEGTYWMLAIPPRR